MKIEIDLKRLQNEDGYYNSNDVAIIEKLTGRPFVEIVGSSKQDETEYFTDAEIKSMSDAEYEASREKILKQASENRPRTS